MQTRLAPAIKGLITAACMIIAALVIDSQRETADPRIQYVVFIIYGIGILWTLFTFRQSAGFTGRFGELFAQGFRCFVVVTLCMVIFTFVFIKMHPEFATIEAEHQRQELMKQKVQDKTPAEIDELVARAKKQYPNRYILGSVFGYLIVGAGITAVASILLTRRQ